MPQTILRTVSALVTCMRAAVSDTHYVEQVYTFVHVLKSCKFGVHTLKQPTPAIFQAKLPMSKLFTLYKYFDLMAFLGQCLVC